MPRTLNSNPNRTNVRTAIFSRKLWSIKTSVIIGERKFFRVEYSLLSHFGLKMHVKKSIWMRLSRPTVRTSIHWGLQTFSLRVQLREMLKLYATIITDSMNKTSNVIICWFVIGRDNSELTSSNYIQIYMFSILANPLALKIWKLILLLMITHFFLW